MCPFRVQGGRGLAGPWTQPLLRSGPQGGPPPAQSWKLLGRAHMGWRGEPHLLASPGPCPSQTLSHKDPALTAWLLGPWQCPARPHPGPTLWNVLSINTPASRPRLAELLHHSVSDSLHLTESCPIGRFLGEPHTGHSHLSPLRTHPHSSMAGPQLALLVQAVPVPSCKPQAPPRGPKAPSWWQTGSTPGHLADLPRPRGWGCSSGSGCGQATGSFATNHLLGVTLAQEALADGLMVSIQRHVVLKYSKVTKIHKIATMSDSLL